MKTQIDKMFQFKEILKNDYGVSLSENETKEALNNLVNFFDLLWRFDQEDKEKEMQMEVKQNGQ